MEEAFPSITFHRGAERDPVTIVLFEKDGSVRDAFLHYRSGDVFFQVIGSDLAKDLWLPMRNIAGAMTRIMGQLSVEHEHASTR